MQATKTHKKTVGSQRKGNKKTKVGWIPEEWEAKALADVGKIYSGGTPDTRNPKFWNGTINWCTPTDITALNGSKYIGNTEAKISEDGLKNCSATLLPKGSIIVCTRATIGKLAIAVEEIATNQGFKNVIPKNKVDTDFLYYSIAHAEKTLIRLGNGSTFLEVPKKDFENLQILLPPLPEQRAITAILTTWDKAIELTRQLIEKKQQLKKGLAQQLLTGEMRFKGFEGEWEEVKLREIAKIRRGASPRPISDPKYFAETGRGWVRIEDVTTNDIYLTSTKQYLSDLGASNSVEVNPGDFIMSICGTIGVPRIVKIPACVHDGFVVISNFNGKLDKFFLYHHINHLTGRLAHGGQPGTQKNLNTSIVGNIQIPNLTLEEQQQIAAVLSACDKEIQLLKQKLAALQQQKKGLMQVLLTGMVRVKS